MNKSGPEVRSGQRRPGAVFNRAFGPGPRPFQLLGRTLLHAALVGVAAGLAGSAFFVALEFAEHHLLEQLAGYDPLRARGEAVLSTPLDLTFRPWVLLVLPALGALVSGVLSARFAPETLGGGGDAIIEAFHHRKGVVRRRVPLIKAIASIFTLGSGGSGGREGPTMQIAGALGSLIGRALGVTDRERRILLVAGTAAGMAAVFRTPLGAALLAVEILHRDDFESDALVPAVLSSVIAYSVFVSFFGESTLFGHSAHYPFIPMHLPLYGLMALVLSAVAIGFLASLSFVRRTAARIPIPMWSKPALGGLALGVLVTPILVVVGPKFGRVGEGFGLLGGGYGAAQVAITGASWFPEGWTGVQLLLILCTTKAIATSFTVGSGGSAGDFGPSLVMGGLVGGAFGRAAQLLLDDPRIDPGGFALVGMGTFFGGLAHVPLASLVMVCELAGSYDLLVPLMLCEGIALVALRNKSLYHAQVPTRRDSPAHHDEFIVDVLRGVRVGDVVVRGRQYVSFERTTPAEDVVRRMAESGWQDIFPVLSPEGQVVGIIDAETLRPMMSHADLNALLLADDMMRPLDVIKDTDDLHAALAMILDHGARAVLVTDADDKIVGFLDEAEITRVYHTATSPADPPEKPKDLPARCLTR